jgi:hypothetical protein
MLNEDNMFPSESANGDDKKDRKLKKGVVVPVLLPPQSYAQPARYGKSGILLLWLPVVNGVERTFLEMVKMALKSLGGRGTVAEITDFIEANYAEELKHK